MFNNLRLDAILDADSTRRFLIVIVNYEPNDNNAAIRVKEGFEDVVKRF